MMSRYLPGSAEWARDPIRLASQRLPNMVFMTAT